MIDMVLFALPTWVVALLVLASCIVAFVVFCACVSAGMADDRIERARERRIARVEDRMIDLNRRDVEERSRAQSFAAWDADETLAQVLPFERSTPAPVIPLATRAMDSDGLGGAA